MAMLPKCEMKFEVVESDNGIVAIDLHAVQKEGAPVALFSHRFMRIGDDGGLFHRSSSPFYMRLFLPSCGK